MNQEHDFDVIIVGGGAVGGTQALELVRLGYKVAMVEASEPWLGATDPERVIALSYGSRCHLQRLGLWDDVLAGGVGCIRSIEVRESHQHGMMEMMATEAGVDALGYVVEMAHIVRAVYTALAEQVTFFCPARMQRLEEGEQSITVELLQAEKVQTLTAKLLIGADGTHSQVRRMAGIATRGWDHNRFGLVASVRCERGHAERAYECFRHAGPLAFLPLSDDRFSIVWALPPQEAMRMLDLPERMFLKRLQRVADEAVLPRSGRLLEVGKRACFPLELRIANMYAKGRVVLQGNAAHTLHPVAGQGLNLGLRDVATFTNLLKREAAHQDVGAAILLSAYAEQRRLDVLAVAGFTESMLATFGNDVPPLQWLRGRGLDAMQVLPWLREPLMQHAAGLTEVDVTEVEGHA